MGESYKFIHYLLFSLTFIAVTLTSIVLDPEGGEPLEVFSLIQKDPAIILKGLPFTLSLLFIIGCHEYGHLKGAKQNGIRATKPYFIPAPPFITLGTFGAFIKIKSAIPNRSALLETGAYGPIFGFFASIFVLLLGYSLDLFGYHLPVDFGFNVRLPAGISFLRYLFYGKLDFEIMLFENPLTASAFIGFFIQGLNLLPVGQLDGGHILYASFKGNHRFVSKGVAILFVLLSPFGFHFLVWAFLFFLLGTNHYPTMDDNKPLSRKDLITILFSFLIFILTFQPIPFIT